jgi:hypothetical protein
MRVGMAGGPDGRSRNCVCQAAEPDGSQTLLIRISGQSVKVTVPPAHLERIVESFQHAAIQRAHQHVKNMPFVRLTVTAAHVAHKLEMSELMVSTLELGSVVLVAESAVLQNMKTEIDRALSYRGGSQAPN